MKWSPQETKDVRYCLLPPGNVHVYVPGISVFVGAAHDAILVLKPPWDIMIYILLYVSRRFVVNLS